jgi:hypothetical protein
LARDVDGPIGRAEIFEKPSDGKHRNIVLALPKRRPFPFEHSDNRDCVPAQLDHFADGRLMREQTLLDCLTDDDHAAGKRTKARVLLGGAVREESHRDGLGG